MLKRWLNKLKIGRAIRGRKAVEIDSSANIYFLDRLSIEDYVYIGPRCVLNCEGGVSIGEGTIIGPDVYIQTSSHRYKQATLLPYDQYDEHAPVSIGRGVWIGLGVMIVPGVVIEDGAVVAMGSVVTRHVLTGQVVGGNPARPIGSRETGVVEELVRNGAYYMKKNAGVSRVEMKIAIQKNKE